MGKIIVLHPLREQCLGGFVSMALSKKFGGAVQYPQASRYLIKRGTQGKELLLQYARSTIFSSKIKPWLFAPFLGLMNR